MEYYSLLDIKEFTGLSERTLREYIKTGILKGEKPGGAWRFSEENITELFENPAVRKSIKAKKNALVYDFMLQTRKKEKTVCFVLDIPCEAKEAMENCNFFCERVNALPQSTVEFSFEHRGKNARIILCGNAAVVLKITAEYYEKV